MSPLLRDICSVVPNCGAPPDRPLLFQMSVVVINTGVNTLLITSDPTGPLMLYSRSEPFPLELPSQFCNKYIVSTVCASVWVFALLGVYAQHAPALTLQPTK